MPTQFVLDLPDLGLHSLALGLAPELEALPIHFRTTTVGKTKSGRRQRSQSGAL